MFFFSYSFFFWLNYVFLLGEATVLHASLLHGAEPFHDAYHERMGVDVGLEMIDVRLLNGAEVAHTKDGAGEAEVEGEQLPKRGG